MRTVGAVAGTLVGRRRAAAASISEPTCPNTVTDAPLLAQVSTVRRNTKTEGSQGPLNFPSVGCLSYDSPAAAPPPS